MNTTSAAPLTRLALGLLFATASLAVPAVAAASPGTSATTIDAGRAAARAALGLYAVPATDGWQSDAPGGRAAWVLRPVSTASSGVLGEPVRRADRFAPTPRQAPAALAASTVRVAPPPAPAAKTTTAKTTTGKTTAGTAGTAAKGYKGTNHVWIPALGINRSVSGFACTSKAYPGDRVYRWGCAGSNNVYLFGHAHSVFKPLHDAYVKGRLKKGMKVIYADGNGKVRTYAVSYWKVVSPVGAEWAFAAQKSPSMTLQTCVGRNSEKRLVVRLSLVG